MSVLHEVVCEIADREGVRCLDLETPLYDVVDSEALETLLNETEDWQDGSFSPIEFVYYDYIVKIDRGGNVTISEQSSTAGEVSKEKLESSLRPDSNKIDHHERAMKDVADIIAARNRPFTQRLNGVLETVRKTLGMESATLSYVDNGAYVFEAVDVADHVEIQAGTVIPLPDTACKRVTETEQELVLKNVEREAPELANSAFNVSSYIGVPVFVDDAVYGTFCFYDTEPRDEEFSGWERALIELLSNWVSSELEQRKRERAFHAATTERPDSVS